MQQESVYQVALAAAMAAVNQNDPRLCYTCGMSGLVQRHCPQNLSQETQMQCVSRWDPRGPGR
eukprot:1869887-Rhodomonas_salina.1